MGTRRLAGLLTSALLVLVVAACSSSASLDGPSDHLGSSGHGPASTGIASHAGTSHAPSSGKSSGPIAALTCAPADMKPHPDAVLGKTRKALLSRAHGLGLSAATVALRSDGSFEISAPGRTSADLTVLCTTASVAFRPVIDAAEQPTGTAHGDPLSKLGFIVPADEGAYLKLTAAQRTKLDAAVRSFDCATGRAPDLQRPALVCDQDQHAYLLAAPIVSAGQVASARAAPPRAGSEPPSWTVMLRLKPQGRQAWRDYTRAHNFGGQTPTTGAPGCDHLGAPCANYLAFVVDNVVLSVPVIAAAIQGGQVQITGQFTADEARTLATKIDGPLPVPLRVVSASNNPASNNPASGAPRTSSPRPS